MNVSMNDNKRRLISSEIFKKFSKRAHLADATRFCWKI